MNLTNEEKQILDKSNWANRLFEVAFTFTPALSGYGTYTHSEVSFRDMLCVRNGYSYTVGAKSAYTKDYPTVLQPPGAQNYGHLSLMPSCSAAQLHLAYLPRLYVFDASGPSATKKKVALVEKAYDALNANVMPVTGRLIKDPTGVPDRMDFLLHYYFRKKGTEPVCSYRRVMACDRWYNTMEAHDKIVQIPLKKGMERSKKGKLYSTDFVYKPFRNLAAKISVDMLSVDADAVLNPGKLGPFYLFTVASTRFDLRRCGHTSITVESPMLKKQSKWELIEKQDRQELELLFNLQYTDRTIRDDSPIVQ